MKRVLLVILCLAAQPLWAAALETELADIQHRWAEIQYQVPADEKRKPLRVWLMRQNSSSPIIRAGQSR